MKLKTVCKSFSKFIFYFMIFFFIQLANSDWNFMFNYDMGKKIMLSLPPTSLKKGLNNERPND